MFSKKLRDVIPTQQLISLKFDQNINNVLELLGKYNICSAPILLSDGSVQGFVDVLDILAYLVKTSTKPLTDLIQGESFNIKTDDLKMIKKRAKDFNLQSLSQVIDISRRNPYHTLYEDQLVSDVVPIFQQGVHRVALLDRTSNKIVGVVSQTDIIHQLAQESNVSILKKRVSETKVLTGKLLSVTEDTTALDSFIQMYQSGVSSLALLDTLGTIVGTVSASDVKWIAKTDDFRSLLWSIFDFVKDIRKQQGKSEHFVACTSDSASVFDVINLMFQEKVHRVFIVDEKRKPKGVISLTDIIREIGAPIPS